MVKSRPVLEPVPLHPAFTTPERTAPAVKSERSWGSFVVAVRARYPVCGEPFEPEDRRCEGPSPTALGGVRTSRASAEPPRPIGGGRREPRGDGSRETAGTPRRYRAGMRSYWSISALLATGFDDEPGELERTTVLARERSVSGGSPPRPVADFESSSDRPVRRFGGFGPRTRGGSTYWPRPRRPWAGVRFRRRSHRWRHPGAFERLPVTSAPGSPGERRVLGSVTRFPLGSSGRGRSRCG